MRRPALDPDELSSVDLADPRLHAGYDLTEVWRHLRDEAPVYWHDKGFWVITRYADVAAVYRDTARFTSERGNVLDTLLAGGTQRPARWPRSPTERTTPTCVA